MLDLNGIAQNEHVLWQVHLDRQIIPISAQHHLEQGSVNRLAQIETRFDKALVERAQPQPFDDVAGRFNRTLCHSDRFEQHLNVQLVATKHYLAPAEIIADRRQRLVELVREGRRSEEHTSELQSLMRISYAVFCLKKKNKK